MLACQREFLILTQYLVVYRVSLALVVTVRAYEIQSKRSEALVLGHVSIRLIFMISFLSIAGSPPFLGFYAKVIVAQLLIIRGRILVLITLVLRSVFLLYIYTRLFYGVLGKLSYTRVFVFAPQEFKLAQVLVICRLVVLPWVYMYRCFAREDLNFQGLNSFKIHK